jgi:hypothetical protein
MLTTGSNVFKCTYEQAKFVAECAGLKYKITSKLSVRKEMEFDISFSGGIFDLWEDKQTSGGGCRICYCNNIVWISRHSGYEWADITEEVKELFVELGCENLEDRWGFYNPLIYGEKKIMDLLNIKRDFKQFRDGD